jgi:predicted DNA-binding protein YlxM (UPF0122 family)
MALEDLPETNVGGSEHPTSEQLLIRMAVDKALMNKQKRVWELYNYARFTHSEIAKKLKITPSAVTQQIKTIEKQLTKWIKQHSEVYNTLKSVPSGSEK